uniref:BHLH transcription factor n=1 Tax=Dracaena cambodiana TaxID=580341 RepID=A0A7M3UQK8_9ASPA|nr:bHLH transcription factor [Dracaena cambodiana]
MDQSSFTNQWDQLSSLNQPQLFPSQHTLTAADHHQDLQLLNNSQYSNSEWPKKSLPKTISWRSEQIPMNLVPKEENTISWNSEQIPMNLVPKEEVPSATEFLYSDSGLNWPRYQMISNIHGRGLKSTGSMGLKRGHAHDEHIIAERKRREKLSQRFIALAALIPGLKKADKASILGDTIKYVKELKHTVKSLEDRNVKKTVESVVLVTKSKLSTDNRDVSVNGISLSEVCSNSDEDFDGSTSSKLPPEIQVRVSESTALLRIHCKNDRGVLGKVLMGMEKLGLMVTNASVMPFAGSLLDITVTAQAEEEEFSMTAKDIAREIRAIFCEFIWFEVGYKILVLVLGYVYSGCRWRCASAPTLSADTWRAGQRWIFMLQVLFASATFEIPELVSMFHIT